MAIVINNTKRVIILNDGVESVRFVHGVREVPDAQWKRVRAHVAERIGSSSADFTEIAEVKKGSKGDEITYKKFADLSPNEAANIVEQTLDVDTLTEWKKQSSRDETRLVIANQIAKMQER